MTIELVSLYEEESARTLGVLDVDGLKGRFNVQNPNTQVGHSRFSFLAEHACAACARKDDSRRRIVCEHSRQYCVSVLRN